MTSVRFLIADGVAQRARESTLAPLEVAENGGGTRDGYQFGANDPFFGLRVRGML